eukprot:TRINITY_DN3451_c0_g1_i1.p1 TRINITY_DN3451_c0_g1~~TRINITY_DN3451_c0_g1_i1.p1  ORF type:complete len:171 (-),score=50.40 TRINITY_DN3451_c0_g1_i1:90-602(-)
MAILNTILTFLTLFRVFFAVVVDFPFALNCSLTAPCATQQKPLCYYPCLLAKLLNLNFEEYLELDPVLKQNSLASRIAVGAYGFVFTPLLILVVIGFWTHKKWSRKLAPILASAMASTLIPILLQFVAYSSDPVTLILYNTCDILLPILLLVRSFISHRRRKEPKVKKLN